MSSSTGIQSSAESAGAPNPATSSSSEKGRKRGASTPLEDGSKGKVQRVEFSKDHRLQLLGNLRQQLPKKDSHSYKSTITKVDWTKVTFEQFTADQCQQEWELIQADIRKFKNATEIVDEAMGLVKNPGYLPKLSALYPNMPKKPLTPFFQYYSEKNKSVKERNPEFSQTKISQVLSEKYKGLPEKKKLKYVTKYAKGMKQYEVEKTTFYQEHPELIHQKAERIRAPACPTPYRLWMEKQMEGKPDVRRSEVETDLRVKWKGLSDKKRLKWIQLALERKGDYEHQIQEYVKKHCRFKPTTKPLLTKMEQSLYDTQQGKPTRPPMNGYSLFCSQFMRTKNGLTSVQKMQACSKEWKQLSEDVRHDYNDRTSQAKIEYYANLKKYVSTLSPEEAAKYDNELKTPKTKSTPSKKKPKEVIVAASTFTGLEVYISEFKEKFAKKHPELKSAGIEKMLTKKYEDLSTAKKDKYEEKAKEMNALSSGSEAGSSSEDESDDYEDDDDEDDDDDDDIMARDLWIEHNLHSYMQVHKLKEARARKSLQLAWENLEKPRKVPWRKQAQQNSNRMQQLLAKMPKKPHTSAYGIYTSEMMRHKDIVSLDHKDKMKAIAERWKGATKTEKKKYENKKDRLWKKHEKDLDKFKETLSSHDQSLLEKALTNPTIKKSSKAAAKEVKAEDSSSSEDESGSESEEEDEDEGSSEESDTEETTTAAATNPSATTLVAKKEKESDDDDESSSSSESSESESEDEAD